MTPRQRLLEAIKQNPDLVDRLLVVAEPDYSGSIVDPAGAWRAVAPLCAGKNTEHLVCVALDRKNRILESAVLTQGSDAFTIVDPKQIFRWALLQGRSGAVSIILAHNHPSGDPTPSLQDIEVTRRVANAGRVLGIQLQDHIIVGDGARYTSLREQGVI